MFFRSYAVWGTSRERVRSFAAGKPKFPFKMRVFSEGLRSAGCNRELRISSLFWVLLYGAILVVESHGEAGSISRRVAQDSMGEQIANCNGCKFYRTTEGLLNRDAPGPGCKPHLCSNLDLSSSNIVNLHSQAFDGMSNLVTL